MYKDFFGLTRFPFHNTPDPAFFFNSRSHREALASMVYGVQEGKGFILVTGDVGSGKTMLVQELKRELGEHHILIEIANPWITAEDVLGAIRQRVDAETHADTALLDGLKQRLKALAEQGTRVVLVIDEAHQVPVRTLEGIRLFSNLETSTEKLMQVVLLGQDELANLLTTYAMRPLQQRIAISYHVQRFNGKETAEYIHHRLRVAGGTPLLFPAECIEMIHQESMGSPRVINQLCDSSLLFAFGRNSPQVTAEIVRDAIANVHPERSIPAMPGASVDPRPASSSAPTAQRPVVETARRGEETPALPGTYNATSAAPEAALPFALPTANVPGRAAEVDRAGWGGGFRWLMLTLLIGVAIGGLGLWYMQEHASLPALTDLFGSKAKPEGRIAPMTPGMQAQGPVSAGQESKPGALAQETPAQAPQMLQPTPAASDPVAPPKSRPIDDGQPPIPGGAAAPLITQEVSIPASGGLSMLASSHFGAWNETVRDLIVAANPGIAELDSLAPGTKLKLPTLNRENLIVRDADGRFRIYFGTFDNAEEARLNLEAMRRLWAGAQLVAAERQGISTQRLFIGVFASQAEARAVANSVWFKHLPALN